MKILRILWPESWIKRRHITDNLTFSLRDCVITVALFLFSSLLCLLLRKMAGDWEDEKNTALLTLALYLFL